MSLTTKSIVQISGEHTSPLDLETPTSKFNIKDTTDLGDGTGANQADQKFSDQRTIAPSGNEDLDLAGGLTDAFGVTLTFVKVKSVYIKAAAANTNDVQVKPAAANGFLGPFNAAADTLKIPAGGRVLLEAPVNGWTVTAGSGDLLNVANGGAGTSVTYDITLVGTSA